MTPLSRRAVLRGLVGGLGASVALPWLEAMLPRGAAAADGPWPSRFGVWFFGNGVRPERWVPTTTGLDWELTEQLAPLEAVKPWISPLTGFEVKTSALGHPAGMAGILSGQDFTLLTTTRTDLVTTFSRRSVDQDAAEFMKGQAPFRSLEVGVARFWGTDLGDTMEHVSHNGPNSPNPAQFDPALLFARLFGQTGNAAWSLAHRSVLDVVADQTSRLDRRLGTEDRRRMQQHLDSIRGLELRLAGGASQCAAPDAPPRFDDPLVHEDIVGRNEIQSRLLALALSCDLTRAFSLQFSAPGGGTVFWQIGAEEGLHVTCHSEPLPQPTVNAAVVFTMAQLSDFLGILRDTPEGDGNLLDHSSILCTTEISDGVSHTVDEFPILIAGGGNGRLNPGVHVRDEGRNASDAVLTALHGAGVDLPEWGVGPGRSETPVDELLA